MANIKVILEGTRKIWRYDRNGLKFIRNEKIFESKVFVTTLNGTYLIDGKPYTKENGNDVYLKMVHQVGERTYDDYCGRYKFKNHEIIKCRIEPITADNVDEYINRYIDSIEPYVEYIDNGRQYTSACEHNEYMNNMIDALTEIYKG